MTKLRVLDLFSGIGGFSLGLERTGGFETVAFCEIEPYCQKVLAKHWPGVPIYGDIRAADYRQSVDVVTAGFPCQDISYAGRAAGISGKRSGLFWQVLRAVRMVGPARIVLENVAALLDRGMGVVCGALAEVGYDAQWDCIRACDVGLPHQRNRVWITANPNGLRELQPGWGIENERGWAVHGVQKTLWDISNGGKHRNDNGVRARVDSLGNAVVPQIPELIGRAILASVQEPAE